MESIQLDIYKNETVKKLLPFLNGEIFHFTSLENSQKINQSGFIKGDRALKKTYSHFSLKSYGRKRGYICLCDLRNWSSIEEEEQEWIMAKLPFLNPRAIDNPCYYVIKPRLYNSFIDWRTAWEEVNGEDLMVPDLECWSKNDISIQDCDLLIKVNYKWDGKIESLTLEELKQLYQQLLKEE